MAVGHAYAHPKAPSGSDATPHSDESQSDADGAQEPQPTHLEQTGPMDVDRDVVGDENTDSDESMDDGEDKPLDSADLEAGTQTDSDDSSYDRRRGDDSDLSDVEDLDSDDRGDSPGSDLADSSDDDALL